MEADPFRSPAAKVNQSDARDGLDVTWARALKVWWSLMWRGVLYGLVAGIGTGAIVGFVLAVVVYVAESAGLKGIGDPIGGLMSSIGGLFGGIAGAAVGVWVVRNILRKSWSDFRIVLLPVAQR